MKKILIAVATVATFAAPQAFAQAKNFEGLSVLGSVNFNNSRADQTGQDTLTKSDTAVGLQAEYGFSLSESVTLGVGATASSDTKISDSTKLKNAYSLYVAPGYAVNKDVLVYGKVAALSATIATDSGTSVDYSGAGIGLGARYFTTPNLFLQAEYMYNKYDEKDFKVAGTKVKDQNGVLSFGVGYRF